MSNVFEAFDVVTLDDVRAARERIRRAVAKTPCVESQALSEATGCRVFCKLEFMQRTGSFKERGACNALVRLVEAGVVGAGSSGVIAASAGNHALALSYHGGRLGVGVTVVMPTFAPLAKVGLCRHLGAEVLLHGSSFAEARARADELVPQRGLVYVHGYDDADVIAGQGTLGLEVLEQVPEGVDAIVIPVGGAGLIAGVAAACKGLSPGVQIIGVEAERVPSMSAAMRAGVPVSVPPQATLADGLAVTQVGTRAFATARGLIDEVVTVSEADLALAILRMIEKERAVVEGAGAAGLAALFAGKLAGQRGKTVVLPLCGGNIDPLVLRRVIEHGMAADGRLRRLTLSVSDRPGGLAELACALRDEGVSVQHIHHDRTFAGPDAFFVHIEVVFETRDAEHAEAVTHALVERGYRIVRESPVSATGLV